jgi:HK97 family phage major capsid protein
MAHVTQLDDYNARKQARYRQRVKLWNELRNGGGPPPAFTLGLQRMLTAVALSDNNPRAFLQRTWPQDETAMLLLKAATTPTATGSYPTLTTVATLPALAPEAAATRLFARAVGVDLSSVAQVSVPSAAVQPQPGFVAEGAPAPVAQFSLAAITVGPAKKILIMSALTRELANATADTAQAVIGHVLSEATAKSLDAALFSNTAGDDTRPAGLLAGVTPITATAGGGLAMVTDVGNLAGAIADAGIATDDMVIIAHPGQATKLRLLAGPAFTNAVLGTPQVAAGTVIAVAPDALFVGYSGAPEVDSSIETAIHFEESAPLPIATGGVQAAPTRSAFQQDLIIIRLRARCAWAAMPGAVQFITGATW